MPDMYGAEDNLKTIGMDELALCREECAPKSQYPCDETVFVLCCLLMQEKGWNAATDTFSAAELYTSLRTEILQSIWGNTITSAQRRTINVGLIIFGSHTQLKHDSQ